MSTIIDLIVHNRFSDSICIIYVDSDANISTLKYSQMWSQTDMCELKIKQTINAPKNSVIGIYSEVNQLIPSFMIAIMRNECLFCYISARNNSPNDQLLIKSLNYVICRQKNRKLFENLTLNSGINNNSNEILFDDYIIMELNKNDNKSVSVDKNESFAYLMTSSGTTGNPKHVYVPHCCVMPNIIDLKEELKVSSMDTILICCPFTFDPSIVDLFIGLSSNSRIVLIDDLIRLSPEKLIKVIEKFEVTLMTVTPSFMSRFTLDMIQNELLSSKTSLRVLIFGGEKSPPIKTINDYMNLNNNKTVIYNIYGITEVSCWATIYKFDPKHCFDDQFDCLPIFGRNLLNTHIDFEDDKSQLIIKSDVRKCLVRTFENNRFDSYKWTDNYRTGDCAKVSKSGQIYITGRSDSVVKLNGIKVDLELIESKLEQEFVDLIKRCVCVAGQWHHMDNSIINVFISIRKGLASHTKTLVLNYLRQQFDKSIAFKITIVDWFPLTQHLKIDRLMLSKTDQNSIRNNHNFNTKIDITYDQVVKRISKHFHHYLNISVTHICDHTSSFVFKNYGGQSITALQIAINIENDFNCDFPSLVDRILNKNLSEISDYVFQVLTCKQKIASKELIEQQECKSKKSSNVIKRPFTEDLGNCVTIITRRGINKFCSCAPRNCSGKLAKQMNSCDDQSSEKPEILWSIDLFECVDASPLIIEHTGHKTAFAFIGSHSGHFVSISLSNGTVNWRIQLNDRIESSAISDRSGTNVFVGDYSGYFYSISAIDGTINWRFKTDGAIKSSPICDSKSSLVFCGSHDKYLYAWNQLKNEDQLVWKCLISDGSIFSSPTLSSNDDLIFAATLDGTLAAIQVDSGLIVWKIDLRSALFSSPAIFKDTLVIGSTRSSLMAVNINDGTVLWSSNTGESVFSSPVFYNYSNESKENNSFVLIGTHDNSVLCIDSRNGQMRWQFKTSSPVYSTPFLTFDDNIGHVFIAETNGFLHSIDASDGKRSFSFRLDGQIFSSPVVYDRKLFIGCRDNNFYCISLK